MCILFETRKVCWKMNLIKVDFVNKTKQDLSEKILNELPLAKEHLKNQICLPGFTFNWSKTYRLLIEHVNNDSILSKVYVYNTLIKKHSQGQLSVGERKMLNVCETYLVKAGLIK